MRMRLWWAVALIVLAARFAPADVNYTPVLNLDKPDKGTREWHQYWWAIVDKLEALRTEKGTFVQRPQPGPKTKLYVCTDCPDTNCTQGGGSLTCIQRTNDSGGAWETIVCSGGGSTLGPNSSADGEIPLFSGTTGNTLKRSAANAQCLGLKNPIECCTGNGTGTCYAAVNTTTGQMTAVSLDTAAKKTTGSCLAVKEATDNAPPGGSPNVIQVCAPANLPADRVLTLLATGNVPAANIEGSTTGRCARFATDVNGNPTLTVSAEDCLVTAQIQPMFDPATTADFFEEFMVGQSSNGTKSGTVGAGWSVVDDSGASGSQCGGNGFDTPIANHPGIYKLGTGSTSKMGCYLKNYSSTSPVWSSQLFTSTTWKMEFNGRRTGTLTNMVWLAGLASFNQTTFGTTFPDKFAGIVLRDTTSATDVPFCKGAGQPFSCCTGNNADGGACTDATYQCVACNGSGGVGPCTVVDTGVTPSTAGTFDKMQLNMSASGILQCGIAVSDADDSFDFTTVTTNVPTSMTPQFYFGANTLDAVAKTVGIDFYWYHDTGLDR